MRSRKKSDTVYMMNMLVSFSLVRNGKYPTIRQTYKLLNNLRELKYSGC